MSFNSRLSIAWVNNYNTSIPVYASQVSSPGHAGGITAGGTQIGAILFQEMYISKGNSNNVTCVKIKFRDGSGTVRYGYIDPSPGYTNPDYAWAAQQEPWHLLRSNGSYLVNASKTGDYFIHTVEKGDLTVLNPSGTYHMTLYPGAQIATNVSTVGQNNDDYVLAYKYRNNSGGAWNTISSGYGFVDLRPSMGTMPWDRAIY